MQGFICAKINISQRYLLPYCFFSQKADKKEENIGCKQTKKNNI